MTFHFSLQAVLRLRVGYEKVERLRLLAFAALAVRVRDGIASLDRVAVEARQNIRRLLSAGVTGIEMHVELACERVRADQRRSLEARLAEISKKQERQRLVFLQARQKREILENLRARKLAEYQKEQARREQQELNDLFLLHRAGKEHE